MMAAMVGDFNKEEAIQSLGFEKVANKRLLQVLIDSEEDFNLLVDFHTEAKRDKEFTATSMLKEYKVESYKLSFEDFMKMYMQDGAVTALRRLFWDDVIQEDVDKYLNAQYLKKYSLTDLHTEYMKKPHTPFLKFVKNI